MVDLVPSSVVREVVAARDAALARMWDAAQQLDTAYATAREAAALEKQASQGAVFYLEDRHRDDHYKNLFGNGFNSDASMEVYRRKLDAGVWTHLLERVGMERLMDKEAKDELRASLEADVPEVTEETVEATVRDLLGRADLIFKRGLANAFSKLDRRFRSHDGFKVGSRVVLTHVFNEWGSWSYGNHHRDTITDIERVLAVLDGQDPDPGALFAAVDASRQGYGMKPVQSVAETRYLRVKGYKNGNAHLWFTDDALLRKVNGVLADYYGEVLGDGVPKDGAAEDIRGGGSRAVSKDLAYYPTPPAVVARLMELAEVRDGDTVLEPSAGTGAIVQAVAAAGGLVHAVEVDPGRAAEIRALRLPGVTVHRANFLQVPPGTLYDKVVMNPPFAGTHWADHVVHAYEFLKPGGKLVAVLPATAEVGSTKRHEAFRAWVEERRGRSWWGGPWRDLPAESFAESGTRVNTVTLELYR